MKPVREIDPNMAHLPNYVCKQCEGRVYCFDRPVELPHYCLDCTMPFGLYDVGGGTLKKVPS